MEPLIPDRSAMNRLRGFAIAAIVFHNFFHWVFTKTQENEIDFDPERFHYFLTAFPMHPSEWVEALFTYFGHLGVQVFIFASAFALALSYPRVENARAFLVSRVRKIYPAFLVAIALFLLLPGAGGHASPLAKASVYATDLALLLVGVYPLVPGNTYPMVGPWWFMPFIMQFYLLWALAGRYLVALGRRPLLALAAGGVLLNYTFTPAVLGTLGVNLLLTPLGHLPEIFFGVFCARFGVPRSALWTLLAFVVLFASGSSAALWPLHHPSALFVMLVLGRAAIAAERRLPFEPLYGLGTISLPLFLVNGFLREPFVAFAAPHDPGWIHVATGVVFFGFACLVAYAVAIITRRCAPDIGFASPPPNG